MQGNFNNKISSSPSSFNRELKKLRYTPTGRTFCCCDNVCTVIKNGRSVSSKHGRYVPRVARWENSRRDHGYKLVNCRF